MHNMLCYQWDTAHLCLLKQAVLCIVCMHIVLDCFFLYYTAVDCQAFNVHIVDMVNIMNIKKNVTKVSVIKARSITSLEVGQKCCVLLLSALELSKTSLCLYARRHILISWIKYVVFQSLLCLFKPGWTTLRDAPSGKINLFFQTIYPVQSPRKRQTVQHKYETLVCNTTAV